MHFKNIELHFAYLWKKKKKKKIVQNNVKKAETNFSAIYMQMLKSYSNLRISKF